MMRNPAGRAETAAVLEHLTGPSRGSASWITGAAADLAVRPSWLVAVGEPGAPIEDAEPVARLHRSGATYELEALNGHAVWVNGERVAQKTLAHGDMIEFGETGPLSRFRLYGPGQPLRHGVDEIVGDCVAYLRCSRRPLPSRVARALTSLGRRLIADTTVAFRLTVTIAILALAVVAYQQSRIDARMAALLDAGGAELERVAVALDAARRDALGPADLEALRHELEAGAAARAARIEVLELRFGAAARIIEQATPAVGFLQGSYGWRERASGRVLRHAVDDLGLPLVSPRGQPLLTLDGAGPPVEINYTGTGFVLAGGTLAVTNRHVAMPWESAGRPPSLARVELEPVPQRLMGYFPDLPEALPLTLVHASDGADLAFLGGVAAAGVVGLELAPAPPAAGDEVVVMGFPTGLRAMLAQAGAPFVRALQADGDTDFWTVAQRLAAAGQIMPLASRGIVARVGDTAIVYDAQTTYGGSGGPVLDVRGRVVAVNSAVLPEFGGANLGVPVSAVRALLDQARDLGPQSAAGPSLGDISS